MTRGHLLNINYYHHDDEDILKDNKTLDDLKEANISLPLTGTNGNAFSVLAKCKRSAEKFGCSKEAVDELMTEMKSGDYNHLLATATRYFDVS